MIRQFLPFLFCCLVAAPTLAADPPHVANTDRPRDGIVVLEPREIWHRGHEDDDLIFGAVRKVLQGPDGNTYVLDTQLSQVFVFDGEGALVRTLSREGDGPGEVRRPEDMVFLPDGCLGICQYINGRIIKVQLDGTPAGTVLPPTNTETGSGMASIRRARYRGGNLVINGARVSTSEDGMVRTQYLTSCDQEGRPLTEYQSRTTASSLLRDGWNEKNNWFPSHELWDIDHQGRVLAAADRNSYRIGVFAQDGATAFTFGREHDVRRRTDAEKQEIRDSVVVLRDGARMEVEVIVEDNDAAVASLHVRPGGEIWVTSVRDRREPPDGAMLAYDVFDGEGLYIRRVALVLPGNADEDSVFFLGPRHLALVRGAVQARRNTFGGSRGEEEDIPAHDLKVYEF